MAKTTEPIDFVITWVDGKDPLWQKEKEERQAALGKNDTGLLEKIDDRKERYRDYDLLQYWFRGVEQFAPWVRTIHFVTWGHLPPWLNASHPKLHIVRHEDYIPGEYLPTFNSNVLEIFLHRIEGLSEQFVYFNDDVFPIRKLEPEDFFYKGKPCDLLAFQPVVANPANPVMSHLFLNNTLVLSRHFNKRECVRKHPGDYFHPGYPPLYFFYNVLELFFPLYTGFYTVHGAFPFCKSTFREVWEKEGAELKKTAAHPFRSSDDITDYLLREWQKLSGNFHPKNLLRDFSYFNLDHSNRKLYQTIEKQKKKMICINDSNQEIEFQRIKRELQQEFHKILPQPSSFERGDYF